MLTASRVQALSEYARKLAVGPDEETLTAEPSLLGLGVGFGIGLGDGVGVGVGVAVGVGLGDGDGDGAEVELELPPDEEPICTLST